MNIKEKYEFIVENVSKQPIGTFPIYDVEEIPDFLLDKTKHKIIDGNYTINIILTDKADDDDYLDYIDYVTHYTGTEEMFPIEV